MPVGPTQGCAAPGSSNTPSVSAGAVFETYWVHNAVRTGTRSAVTRQDVATKAVAAARDTATNPAVTGAFALAISAAEEPPAFAGIAGREPNLAKARDDAGRVSSAMGELRKLVPKHGSYVSESDYFEADWQGAFWGANYPRLRTVKDSVDPDGLFFVHHGVGSEDWSPDGFTRT